jgi:hypothetical protein
MRLIAQHLFGMRQDNRGGWVSRYRRPPMGWTCASIMSVSFN